MARKRFGGFSLSGPAITSLQAINSFRLLKIKSIRLLQLPSSLLSKSTQTTTLANKRHSLPTSFRDSPSKTRRVPPLGCGTAAALIPSVTGPIGLALGKTDSSPTRCPASVDFPVRPGPKSATTLRGGSKPSSDFLASGGISILPSSKRINGVRGIRREALAAGRSRILKHFGFLFGFRWQGENTVTNPSSDRTIDTAGGSSCAARSNATPCLVPWPDNTNSDGCWG